MGGRQPFRKSMEEIYAMNTVTREQLREMGGTPRVRRVLVETRDEAEVERVTRGLDKVGIKWRYA